MKSSQGIYSRMLEFARPYWGRLILAMLCFSATAGLESLTLYLIKPVMDKGFLNVDPLEAHRMLKWLPLGIIGTLVLKGAFSYIADLLNNGVSHKLAMSIRERVFGHLTRLELGYHSHQRVGQISSSLSYDTANMQSGISDVVGKVFGSGVRVLALACLIFYQNWRLALEVAIVFPVAMGPLYYFGRKVRRFASQDQERMADMSALAQEVISGIRVVMAFNQEARERQRFREAVMAYYHAVTTKLRASALSSPVMETIGGVGFALMIFLAGNLVVDKQMTMGEFVSLMGAVAAMYPQFKSLNGVNVSIQNAIAAGTRVFAILDTPIAIQDKPGAQEVYAPRRGLIFEKVSFSYGEHAVLKDISFQVKAGKRVALVGPSGAGKTTLVDLVPRFHDASKGSILWDDVDVKDAKLLSLRAQIGVVTQDTFLFNDSIAANIAYGRPGATRLEIEAAAKAANAHAFILEQPQGYDTNIGERGGRLSGGQRQRLSIARAIIKNPPVLILDEATASLDTESERAVQDALDRLMKNRTTLVIAHRLSTVRHADEILVLDKGKIVERGKHALLLKKGGLYARLYKMQFGRKAAAKAEA